MNITISLQSFCRFSLLLCLMVFFFSFLGFASFGSRRLIRRLRSKEIVVLWRTHKNKQTAFVVLCYGDTVTPKKTKQNKNSTEKNSKYFRKIVKTKTLITRQHAPKHDRVGMRWWCICGAPKWFFLATVDRIFLPLSGVFCGRGGGWRWRAGWFVWLTFVLYLCLVFCLFVCECVFCSSSISLQVVFSIFNEIAVTWLIANVSWTTVWIFQTTITGNLTAIAANRFFAGASIKI